jgi:hypothetical protein
MGPTPSSFQRLAGASKATFHALLAPKKEGEGEEEDVVLLVRGRRGDGALLEERLLLGPDTAVRAGDFMEGRLGCIMARARIRELEAEGVDQEEVCGPRLGGRVCMHGLAGGDD